MNGRLDPAELDLGSSLVPFTPDLQVQVRPTRCRVGEILVPPHPLAATPDHNVVSFEPHGFETAARPDTGHSQTRDPAVRSEEGDALDVSKRDRCVGPGCPDRTRRPRLLLGHEGALC